MNTEQLLLGTTANLYVLRFSRFGVYLGSGTDRDFEVLLPNNQVSDSLEKGDKIDVFCTKILRIVSLPLRRCLICRWGKWPL